MTGAAFVPAKETPIMTAEMTTMLNAETYAVVGASRDPAKYGFLVYKAVKAAGKTAWPVNPSAAEVDGDRCCPALDALPGVPNVAVLIVPPAVSESVAGECARLGIKNIWMQPGAESEAAVAACHASGLGVVSGGPCLMVLLRAANHQN